jgi:hypothetical protein
MKPLDRKQLEAQLQHMHLGYIHENYLLSSPVVDGALLTRLRSVVLADQGIFAGKSPFYRAIIGTQAPETGLIPSNPEATYSDIASVRRNRLGERCDPILAYSFVSAHCNARSTRLC